MVGDYAFAVWDERDRALFCARDHAGIRPFFYAQLGDSLLFGSRLSEVLRLSENLDSIDDDYAIAYLTGRADFASRTFYRSIRRLPPGHSLTFKDGVIRVRRYWDPSSLPDVRFSSDREYAECAVDLLTRAVRDRLSGAINPGVHLSPGLDSGSVAVIAARELRRQGRPAPYAFSYQPAPDGFAPVPWEHLAIQTVAAQEALNPVYCPIDVESVRFNLRLDVASLPNGFLYAEWPTLRAATARGVDRILGGMGGDEGLSFSGMGGLIDLFRSGQWARFYRMTKTYGRRPYRDFLRVAAEEVVPQRFQWLRRHLRIATNSEQAYRYAPLSPLARGRALPPPRGPSRLRGIRHHQEYVVNAGAYARLSEPLQEAGAPVGIEYAFPLADRRVMEFAAGLPLEQFLQGRTSRYLMRTALAGILPAGVRGHAGKSEPVRRSHHEAVRDRALAESGVDWDESCRDSGTASFVDLAELKRRLDPQYLPAEPRPQMLLNALQLLRLGQNHPSVEAYLRRG